jgi:hypothetical protein
MPTVPGRENIFKIYMMCYQRGGTFC